MIGTVTFTDSTDASISLVDFYLNHHKGDEEFAFMHLSDLYDMNVPQDIQSYTGEFFLNKTAIYYDRAEQDYIFENLLHENDTSWDSLAQFLINQSPRVFPQGVYHTSAEISATRDNEQKTNVIPFDDLYMKYPIQYVINMNPENHADIHRATTAVSVPHYLHFGKITNVTVNGVPANNILCNNGCLVILPNTNQVDIVAHNQWGGKIINQNLTATELVPYDESIWIDLLPMRLVWIFFGLVILYISYRALKMIFARRKGR